MIQRIAFCFTLTIILSSCALNKLFLVPYTLETDSTFKNYHPEFKDTVTLTFNEQKMPLLRDSKNELVDFSFSLETVFFPNSNGDSIYAWFYKPKTDYNGITLYFLHGNAGNNVYHNGFVTPFVKAGFQVFMIDYSGFGFSQGKTTRKNVYIDANAGLAYLKGRKDIKYNKLLVYGQSLGGHLASVIATENQDLVDGLIIEGAFSSHKDIASQKVPILGRIFVREIYSAEKTLPKFKKPLLVIHSTEDETIPYKHGLRLYEVATGTKSMYTIDKPHIRGPIYFADNIVARMKKMVE